MNLMLLKYNIAIGKLKIIGLISIFGLISILVLFTALVAHPRTICIKNLKADFSKFNIDNFEVLRHAYKNAYEEDCSISYEGIDTIRLDIPKTAKPIQLSKVTDFGNVVFIVNNYHKDFTLFEYSHSNNPIEIDIESFYKSNYSTIKEFNDKNILLIVKDKIFWVKERVGYGHPHIRQDIVLINYGKAQNKVIQPYDNIYSNPEFSYCDVTNDSIEFRNINFIRTEESTHKTFLLRIKNSNNISISNLCIKTPNSNLYGDAALTFINCANIWLTDVIIEGTYSQKDKYGYGISMNNVYDCHFKNVSGNGAWGVFGTNNVNTVYIENCNLNRFDIHCYGRDVICYNTNFHSLYNQFSSFYGTLRYDNCSFVNFVPLLIDGSYSAYTEFNLYLTDCSIQVDTRRPFLCSMSHSKFLLDSIRPELKGLEYPNIKIKDLSINSDSDLNVYYLFHTYQNKYVELDKCPRLEFDNLHIDKNIKDIRLSNSKLNCNYQFPNIR